MLVTVLHGLLFYFTAFCPFHIGQFTVILLSLEEVVSKSLKNPFVMVLIATCTDNIWNWFGDLQSWPELLGHKGNKPVKMTYFLPPPPPDAMLMSGIQVIFGRLNIAWGEGGTKEMVY